MSPAQLSRIRNTGALMTTMVTGMNITDVRRQYIWQQYMWQQEVWQQHTWQQYMWQQCTMSVSGTWDP